MCCLQYTAHIFCTTMFNTALYKHHYYILNSCIGAAPATIVIHICKLHSPSPSHPIHKICTMVHTSDSFQNTVHYSSCIFPPLLRIPQVMLIISTPRNMKISLPHSPSDFLLPHILCSPYIAAPSPAVILSVSSSRRYWVHISYTPWYRLSLLLKLEVPLPQPSSP